MPVSCDIYSQLELAAMRQTPVKLLQNNQCVYEGVIRDLQTQDGQEYFVTADNQKLPLEAIDCLELLKR